MKVLLRLKNNCDYERKQEWITTGIPIAKGALPDEKILTLTDGNNQYSFQTDILERWSDGSIKWILLDFSVNLTSHEQKTLILSSDLTLENVVPPSPVIVEKNHKTFQVNTGAAIFYLDSPGSGFLSKVRLSNGVEFDLKRAKWVLIARDKSEYFPVFENISVESQGPLRISLKLVGIFKSANKKAIRFFSRISFYSGRSSCKIQWTLWNPHRAIHQNGIWDLGDPGSVFFKNMELNFPWIDDRIPELRWACHDRDNFKTFTGSSWSLYQDSSGGENWKSHNHLNYLGQIPVSFKGYVVEYDQKKDKGDRAQPVLILNNKSICLGIGIEKFWQNFPKSIEWNNPVLSLGLFPRQFNDDFELQGGERKTGALFFDFGTDAIETEAKVKSFLSPLVIKLDPKYYSKTEVFGSLNLPDEDTRSDYTSIINHVIDGKNNFFQKREIIDEYGWRHFGCLYGDHEAVKTNESVPLVSHYNNQYDPLLGFILHYFRSGDARWRELAVDLASHTMDIDIYHTSEDKSAYCGGYFWHTEHYRDAGRATHRTYTNDPYVGEKKASNGGGPGDEHNYTTGLLHYYFLTGDPIAKETVIELANWVLNMEDGSKTFFKYLDKNDTGLSSQTTFRNYHGPGRGAGNSINALMDAYTLTKEEKYISRAELLIRRCVHPKDNILMQKLDQPEDNWSYLVFLQVLGRYLDFKLERGITDYNFYYARESLLHYARWMLINEVPFSEVKHKLLIWTETWPAQDIRKSHVFDCAAKYSNEPLRTQFFEKADYFFNRSIDEISKYDTRFLTRPLVVLMVNGVFHGAFKRKAESFPLMEPCKIDFGKPTRFIPQMLRVKIKLAVLFLAAITGLFILFGLIFIKK